MYRISSNTFIASFDYIVPLIKPCFLFYYIGFLSCHFLHTLHTLHTLDTLDTLTCLKYHTFCFFSCHFCIPPPFSFLPPSPLLLIKMPLFSFFPSPIIKSHKNPLYEYISPQPRQNM